MTHYKSAFFGIFFALGLSACAAQVHAQEPQLVHPNGIQPETTMNLSATASVDRAPEVAIISGGVETEGKTAREAMQQNAVKMDGLIGALEAAGVPRNRIQTSNFSLSPRYQNSRLSSSSDNQPRIIGYVVNNQVTAEIRDLELLGETLDAMVSNGGNRLGNIQFALIDPKEAQDEARKKAIAEIMDRAEFMADATGYKIRRIVTISEGYSGGGRPTPVNALSRAESAVATPVLGGEVSYSANISIMFELEPK